MWKFHPRLCVGFWAILDQRQVFTKNWIAHALYLSARSCDAMYRVWESKSKLELFYRMFLKLFLPYFFGSRLESMFERSLKLSLHIPKRFDAFQVLKWFLLLLEVTCIIFARVTNTDVWQPIVACAQVSENCSKPP